MWERYIDWLPPAFAQSGPGIEPASQVCALDGNRTRDASVYRPNWLGLNYFCCLKQGDRHFFVKWPMVVTDILRIIKEGSKALLPRLVLVEGGPVHEASSVEAEIHLGSLWSQARGPRPGRHVGPRDAETIPVTLCCRDWISRNWFLMIRTWKIKNCLIWVCFYAIIFVQKTSRQFEILDFFIIWSRLVFRSRILVLFGRVVFIWGGGSNLNIISLVLLCRSSSDIPVFLSPHTPKKLSSFL